MAITRAQIARELYIKGGVVNPDGRRGFGGGADMGQVGTDGKQGGTGSNKGLSGPSKGGYQGGPKGGYGDAGRDGPTDRNPYDKGKEKFKEIREKEKEKYEKQFFDKGEVPPLGSRPTSLKTKLDQFNKQKRLDYVRDLIETRKDKIRKGLIQYQDKVGQIQGLTDFDTLQDYIDQVQSVDDLVASGFYSKDGKFSKGAVPDFSTKTGIPTADILGNIFGGPVTKERLNELMGEVNTLEGLQTTKGLENTNFNELMETYQPNRFKLMNPEPGGGDNNYVPPIIQEDDTTDPEDPKQILSTRILGSQFDPTFFANEGGRAALAEGGMPYEGGIMDLESGRQMYFLGKLVKKATRAVKKIAKSPFGKAALFAAPFAMSGGSLGAGLGKFFGKGSLNPFLAKSIGGDQMFSGLGSILSKAGLVGKSGLPTLKGGLALTSLLPLLSGKEEDDFDIDAYYAANQLTPGTTKRQMGSEFDFYNYNLAEGGMPSKEPVAKETMPLIDMDGKEMDLRAEGGFVPIGRMEKADDVPARLSKNEFVFTADAVRNAGEGDIDKGAEVMYNMMKNLESGGEVSEESQGLDGAREMFQTSKRLEEVL